MNESAEPAAKDDIAVTATTPSDGKPAEAMAVARNGPLRRRIVLALLIALAALLVWQVVDLRLRATHAQSDLDRRASTDAALAGEVRAAVRQGQEAIAGLQQRLAVVEARLGDMQGQQATLEAFQLDLSRGREEWLLIEVEQLISLASQQLQLAGNVQAAVQALATADARLARVQRPHFIALRKAVAQDLQRLKATPSVDIAGIGLRIENIVASVDGMGLAYESRPSAPSRAPAQKVVEAPAGETWWQRSLREFWAEVRSLVRIERLDRPDPVLLAPNQTFFLRENLKLRLLTARVELLSRDQTAFRAEVRQALQWIEKHFDLRDRKVQSAVELMRPFLAAEFSIEAPTLSGSQAALRAIRLPGK
jgi:uroporphyrin-3 C-methyltransferase